MSLFGAMLSGVTGLEAQAQSLGMTADNISNSTTIGFKTTDARFSSLVTEVTSLRYAPGGVRSRPFSLIDRQGLLQGTTSDTDMAISGDGFFAVRNTATVGSGSELVYTRAGDFAIDADGNMKNSAGYFLQAWPYDATGTTVTGTNLAQTQTVNVSGLASSAVPTSNVDLSINLDANTAVAGTFAVDVGIVDSLGANHNVRLTYTKTAANAWSVAASDPNGTIGGAIAVAPAALTFDPATGQLLTPAGGALTITPTTPYTSSGATAPANFTVDMVPATGAGSTQFAGFNDIRFIDQNGAPTGSLVGLNIEEDGDIVALFDNSARRNIYRIPIATFQNANGVDLRDATVFAQTTDSGTPTPHVAGTGGSGVVIGAALEQSTSDIGTEFSKLIVTQRSYSANTRTITTADEMLEELLRIKR